jgi:hypothetical protein
VVSCRERKKVGMLFTHLKRILRLDRLRQRGPNGAKDEFLLAATAQKSEETGEAHPAPGARIHHMRRRARLRLACNYLGRTSPSSERRVLQRYPSIAAVCCAPIAFIRGRLGERAISTRVDGPPLARVFRLLRNAGWCGHVSDLLCGT